MRFRRRDNFHPVDAGHWYAITFRLAGAGGDVIPDCGSARWINAQWKYDTSKAASAAREDEFLNGSPFLAQRFDNGVLHVTVEDGFCRCLIAKGPGDPDQVAARMSQLTAPVRMTEVAPLRCADDKGLCRPPHLKLLAAEPDALESLPNPRWLGHHDVFRAGRRRAGAPASTSTRMANSSYGRSATLPQVPSASTGSSSSSATTATGSRPGRICSSTVFACRRTRRNATRS